MWGGERSASERHLGRRGLVRLTFVDVDGLMV